MKRTAMVVTMGVVSALQSGLVAPVGAQEVIEVPLEVVDGRLAVPVTTAGGEKLRFALSTANGTTVLTESTRGLLDADGQATFAGSPLDTQRAAVIPDEQLGGLDGMIASNTLSAFDILVDAPGGRLLLRPAGPPAEWEGVALSEPTRMRVYHGVVLGVDVELDGRTYGAALDLGTQSVIGNSALGENAGVENGGSATLRIGSLTLEQTTVTIQDLPVLSRFDPNGAGYLLVGAPIAYDCAIALSWVRSELRSCVR